MFSVPDSILKHSLAIPLEQFLEQLVNPRNRKLVHRCGKHRYMEEDKESHESAPDIPPDHEKKKEPPDKPHTDTISVHTLLLHHSGGLSKTPATTLLPPPKNRT